MKLEAEAIGFFRLRYSDFFKPFSLDDTIQFLFNPEEIQETLSVSYSKRKIPGHANPLVQYSGGEGKTLEFTLHLEKDIVLSRTDRMPSIELMSSLGLKSYASDGSYIDQYLKIIEALTKPQTVKDVGRNLRGSPPLLQLVLGPNSWVGYIDSGTKFIRNRQATDYSTVSATVEIKFIVIYNYNRESGFLLSLLSDSVDRERINPKTPVTDVQIEQDTDMPKDLSTRDRKTEKKNKKRY